jgi:hypothetical protein
VTLVVVAGCGRLWFDPATAFDDARTIDASVVVSDSPFAPTSDAPAAATTVRVGACPGADLAGVVDTSLDDTRPNENFGRRVEMRVGNNRVSLIRFDTSSLPSAAPVFSASLEISVSPTDALEQGFVEVAPVLEPWTEGSGDFSAGVCNWTSRDATNAWTNAGAGAPGSRSASVIGSFVPNVEGVRHDVPLDPTVVEAWLAGGINAGVALYGVNTGTQGAWLATREATDPSLRPCLRITYVP